MQVHKKNYFGTWKKGLCSLHIWQGGGCTVSFQQVTCDFSLCLVPSVLFPALFIFFVQRREGIYLCLGLRLYSLVFFPSTENIQSYVWLQCSRWRWSFLQGWWLYHQCATNWWWLDVWYCSENWENGNASSKLYWVC